MQAGEEELFLQR